VLRDSLLEQVEEDELRWNYLAHVHLEKWLLNEIVIVVAYAVYVWVSEQVH